MSKIAYVSLAASIAFTGPAFAMPAAVDLALWEEDNLGLANWNVENAPTNNEVFQSVNGEPTIFFDAGASAQGTALSGSITVEQGGDDDYIGFVLGYQDNELTSTMADFILVDWKQRDQTFSSRAGEEGLAISYVSGDRSAGVNLDFWDHSGTVMELERGNNLGDTGWVLNQAYDFDLVFTSGLITVSVDGVEELSITPGDAGLASFTDGSFGFYNYSQSGVRYGSIAEDVVDPGTPPPPPAPPTSISEPGSLALLSVAMIGLGLAQRRRIKL